MQNVFLSSPHQTVSAIDFSPDCIPSIDSCAWHSGSGGTQRGGTGKDAIGQLDSGWKTWCYLSVITSNDLYAHQSDHSHIFFSLPNISWYWPRTKFLSVGVVESVGMGRVSVGSVPFICTTLLEKLLINGMSYDNQSQNLLKKKKIGGDLHPSLPSITSLTQ